MKEHRLFPPLFSLRGGGQNDAPTSETLTHLHNFLASLCSWIKVKTIFTFSDAYGSIFIANNKISLP